MLTRGNGRRWVTLIVVLLGSVWLLPGQVGAGPSSSLALTPANAFNPIGTDHTLTATISPATAGAKVFFQVGGVCSGGTADGDACFPLDTACTAGGGACVGPDLGGEFDCTTGAPGTCEGSYLNTEGTGVNEIRACALTQDNLDSVADYAGCAADPDGIVTTGDPATKTWLAPRVDGGWDRGTGKTRTHGGGEFHVNSLGAIVGRYEIKNETESCRFDTFENLRLDCTTGNTPCISRPENVINKATVDMEGTCKKCGSIKGTLVVVDNGKPGKTDQVQWTTSTTGQCQPADFPNLPDGQITGGDIHVHDK